MKTISYKTLLVLAVVLLVNNARVHGQSTTSGATGNNYSSTSFLGWGTTSGDLLFKVNNTTRMTLQNTTGNLGIGTISPGAPLEIVANTSAFALKLSTNSATVAGLAAINFNTQANRGLGSQIIGYNTGAGELGIYTAAGTKLGFYQNALGNVGIGTTSPSKLLHVYGSEINTTPFTNTIAGIKIQNVYGAAFGSGADLVFGGPSTSNIAGIMGVYTVYNGSYGGDLLLGTNPGSGIVERMRISSNGNVGIGTTSPFNTLEIKGAANQLRLTSIGTEADIRYFPTSGHAWQVGVAPSTPNSFQFYEEGPNISQLTIKEGGNVGIGTTTPSQILHVARDGGSGGGGLNLLVEDLNTTYASKMYAGVYLGNALIQAGTANRSIVFWDATAERMRIASGGNVLIGKTSQANSVYKLDVNGSMRANEVVVNTTGADFVFDENYKLRKLEEVEKFIKENKHLPEIQSAEEMQCDGLEVGKLNTSLLQKVEEITLYMVQMNKEIQELKVENEQLKASIKK